jgi:hypothetical protein
MNTCGFIGNFNPPFSTENDRVWSLQILGHDVITFQENEVNADDLMESATKLDVLFYSHTHGWEIEGLKEVFAHYKKLKIPTASIHLDRWVGLDRETDIGKEATWFTEFQFMADGSPEAIELYNKHNLRWKHVQAGVIARDCYMAEPDPIKYPHEIVFIGSKGYHKEYPFRAELIDWLAQKFGDRFGHYGGDGLGVVRGHDLNVLCATAKMVIGDTCFAGTPNYVSDRYYEIRGRGGFLIHPFVEGVDALGVDLYKGGDLKSLERTIFSVEHWQDKIDHQRKLGFNWVRNNETYTHRMREIMGYL